MKLTLERILLIIIIGLLIFNGFFNKDNSAEKILLEQNKKLSTQIDSVNKEIKELGKKLETVKLDTVTIIKTYTKEIVTASGLIAKDSSNANRIIRYELNNKEGNYEHYLTDPLTNAELAMVGYKLIEFDKTKKLLNNYMNREEIYEMKLIEKDEVIKLLNQKIENYDKLIEESKPAWYDNFYMGAGVAALVGLLSLLVAN